MQIVVPIAGTASVRRDVGGRVAQLGHGELIGTGIGLTSQYTSNGCQLRFFAGPEHR